MNLKKKPDTGASSDEQTRDEADLVPPLQRQFATRQKQTALRSSRYFIAVLATIFVAGLLWKFSPWRSLPSGESPTAESSLSSPTLNTLLSKLGDFEKPLTSPFADNWIGDVRYTIADGQSLAGIFAQLGFSDQLAANAAQILKRLEAEHQFRPLAAPGTELIFRLNETSRLESLILNFPRNREIELRVGQNNSLTPIIRTDEQLLSDRTAFGSIETSFSEAALKAGVDYDVIDDFVDLFSDRVEFKRELQSGDRFTLVYRKRDPLKLSKAGEPVIIAAAMEVNGKQLFVARFQGADGKYRYFDERGQPLGNTFLRYPLKFSRISSYFTNSRFHPVLKKNRPHNGIDFAAPVGTPVRSVADGVVEQAGYNGGAGNMVKIKHGDRYSTAYLHLHSITKGVKAGARVKRGDVIGGVGSTGLSTGPHLHFSFFDRGTYVDPFKIKLPTLDLLPTLKMSDTYLKRVLDTLTHFQSVDITQLRKILKTPPKK